MRLDSIDRVGAAAVAAARAAVEAALPDELARKIGGAPAGIIIEAVADMVASGNCTVAQAVEAVELAVELGDASDGGEISEDHGLALMRFLAERHLGAPPG